MQRHLSRVVRYCWLPAIAVIAVLVSDMEQALIHADKNIHTIMLNAGWQQPPDHIATYIWTHPWAALLVWAAVFAFGVALSWGFERLWQRWKPKEIASYPVHAGSGGDGGSGSIVNGSGLIFGGNAGTGGTGGTGGHGGGGEITGGYGVIIGGDGGDAGQADGSGGDGGNSGLHRAMELGLVLPQLMPLVGGYRSTNVSRDVGLAEALAFAEFKQWGRTFFDAASSAQNEADEQSKRFRQLAHDGNLTVWGKRTENGVFQLIPKEHWLDHNVEWFDLLRGNPRTENVMHTTPQPYSELMANKAEFEREWPHA